MNTATPTGSASHPRIQPRPALIATPASDVPVPAAWLHTTQVRPVYAAKPLLDYTLAPLLFAVGFPFMLLAMFLVKLTSPGPAIYTQARVGRAGRVFTIYKIRTMYHNCEKLTGPQWSSGKNDLRITPIGRILRALHIDELPQLWNVLRGEMSLIGPRPERPEIVEDLRVSVYGYDVRHEVKPGLTGFAQIHLPPDANILTVKNKLIYDRFYISRVSLLLDLKILICTGFKVFGLKMLYCRPPRKNAHVD